VCSEIEPNEPNGRANLPVNLLLRPGQLPLCRPAHLTICRYVLPKHQFRQPSVCHT